MYVHNVRNTLYCQNYADFSFHTGHEQWSFPVLLTDLLLCHQRRAHERQGNNLSRHHFPGSEVFKKSPSISRIGCCFAPTDYSKFLVCVNLLGNKSDSDSDSERMMMFQ